MQSEEFQRGKSACVFIRCVYPCGKLITGVSLCRCALACVGGYTMCDKGSASQKFGGKSPEAGTGKVQSFWKLKCFGC